MLVGDDAQGTAGARETEHGEDEVRPLLAVEPGRANHLVPASGPADRLLAGQLGPPVGALRMWIGGLADGLGRGTAEDIVGAQVAEEDPPFAAGLAEHPGTVAVDAERLSLRRLGCIDAGPGGAIERSQKLAAELAARANHLDAHRPPRPRPEAAACSCAGRSPRTRHS